MKSRSHDDERYRVPPERIEPCVWMMAGLLSYRLCDRYYDCEHCPLDAAIHGPAAPPAPASREVRPALEIRNGLRYRSAHGWIADAPEGRLRWGIDGVAAKLLDQVTGIVLPTVGASLVQGQIACWVIDDGELMPLRSPVSGIVARTNHAVQHDPPLVSRSPYEAGWLIEVGSRVGAAQLKGLCGAEARRTEAARQMARFYRLANSQSRTPQGVGPTLQDGGQPFADLRRALGKKRYHRIVLALLA